ncbi:uncharacterized protein LOC129005317 [Macrosteles quadrilineatus]|uniref:uncharacterized protein LOC129005317 n=1 Tax=Macrosteles quadrilineatus TaxID=74068 RepID=UPI0023E1E069|nr:uncharacterized protein LOC129005317 [Macrosteles quadrilineatus]
MQVLRILTLSALVAVCWCEDVSTAAPTANSSVPVPDPAKTTSTDDATTNRTRRSDVIGLFNSKLHKKFSLLGSLSSLSSSHPHIPATAPDCHSHTLTYDHKAFSLWSFKKAIFSTLLQAIKAITGGVIALKGQIIKVKGHLIAAKGHLLQTKGEAISDFGRHIATKALLSPVHVPPSATGLSATGIGSTGYAAHKPIYGPPSASGPGTGYGAPPKPVYGPPPFAKLPPSSYGPPPAPSSSYGAPSAPSAPAPSPPTSNYGAPPPPVPSTSYGVPVASAPAPSGGGDYSGPPPPSSSGSSSIFLPPSFPSSPGFSAPSTGYGSPYKRDIKLPEGVQAGLLVLKPINLPASSTIVQALDPRHRVRKQALPPTI